MYLCMSAGAWLCESVEDLGGDGIVELFFEAKPVGRPHVFNVNVYSQTRKKREIIATCEGATCAGGDGLCGGWFLWGHKGHCSL